MKREIKNKSVIITGGTSGIGYALAAEFGRQGAQVLITGRNPNRLADAVNNLKLEGILVAGFVADVSSESDNIKMAEEAIRLFGKIDILINNAGMSMRALFEELELKVIRQLMEVNFFGTVYATKACLSEIIRNKGSIVGISSIAGYRGLPGRTGYSASKAAMQLFFECLRTELLYSGVQTLVVNPGFTASNIRNTALTANGQVQAETPLDESKLMPAEKVATEVINAIRDNRRDLILTSQGKLTVFLNKWLPKFMDKMVFNHMAKEKNSPLRRA